MLQTKNPIMAKDHEKTASLSASYEAWEIDLLRTTKVLPENRKSFCQGKKNVQNIKLYN